MKPAGAQSGDGGPFVGPFLIATTGAYSFTLRAADPTVYTPQPVSSIACPTPSGGAGRAANPIANATYATGVSSLAPDNLGWGQVVPLEIRIPVGTPTTPENGKLQFRIDLDTRTTANDNFGFDASFGIYCAFLDTAESTDPGANAKVDSFVSGANGTDIRGTIVVSGLDTGDVALIEVWGVLRDPAPTNTNGNVQASMVDFTTCVTTNPCAGGSTGSIGNQTISIQKTQDFFSGASADVSVTKADSPDPVLLNGTLTYMVTVTNNGPDVANGVSVVDTLPGQTTFNAALSSSGCTVSSGTVTCPVAFLNPGQTATRTIVVTVNAGAPTAGATQTGSCVSNGNPAGVDLCNVVRIPTAGRTPDAVAGNDTDSEPTNVLPTADVSVTKTDTVTGVTAGDGIVRTFTIVVSNAGPSAAGGVILTDTWPAGYTRGTITPGAGNTCADVGSGPSFSCNLGTINAGASETVTVTYTVPLTTPGGTLTNDVSVTTTTAESNAANNSASDTNTVTGATTTLEVAKSDGVAIVNAGTTTTYTITVKNAGSITAQAVSLTDTLPAANVSNARICEVAGAVTCASEVQYTSYSSGSSVALGSIAAGVTRTFMLRLDVDPTAPSGASLVNTAAASSVTDPGSPRTATDTDTVAKSADLSITKSDGVSSVTAGTSTTYTITVTNLGPSAVPAGVVISGHRPGRHDPVRDGGRLRHRRGRPDLHHHGRPGARRQRRL